MKLNRVEACCLLLLLANQIGERDGIVHEPEDEEYGPCPLPGDPDAAVRGWELVQRYTYVEPGREAG